MTTSQSVDATVAKRDLFEHIGLLYRTPDEFLAGVLPFVQAALDAGSPVLAALPPANLDRLRAALGADERRVRFADMSRAGRNPGVIIPRVLLAFASEHAGQRVSVVGEPIWPGRSAVEYPACVVHEALINVAFAGRDAAILCPMDALGLGSQAVADSHATHPIMIDSGRRSANPSYLPPGPTLLRSWPLTPPPAEAVEFAFADASTLGSLRRFVAGQAALFGLDAEGVSDLAVAVNELAANSAEHTPAGGVLTVWTDGKALICQLDDSGQLTDLLAGRIPPAPTSPRGRGLLLVNDLCDLVRIHSEPGRTVIRIYTYRR